MNDDNNKNKKKEQSDEELLKNVTGTKTWCAISRK